MEAVLIPMFLLQAAHFVCARREARRIELASLARNPAEFEYLAARKG